MAPRLCNPLLEANSQPSKLHLNSLQEEMRHTIWAVVVKYEASLGEYVEQLTTGVCIDGRGYILVSSICFEWADDLKWEYTILVRGFLGESYTQARRVETINVGFGLALLKVEQDCDFAQVVVENENDFFRGRNLYSISHRSEYDTFNFLYGHLASELVTVKDVSIQEEVLSTFFNKHIRKEDKHIGEEDKHIREEDEHLLVIRGFCSHSGVWPNLQGLGAPVFNLRGQIIGVIVASQRGFDYAIPSSCLIDKLRDIKE